MLTSEIRAKFLEYFSSNGHEVLIQAFDTCNDDTLLFTNAGMVQFKDVFLGTDKRTYKRATTTQRAFVLEQAQRSRECRLYLETSYFL